MTKEEKNLQNAMTEGVIWKQLLLFFFPIVLGTFFQQLYNTADAIIVGKFVGKEALAAVGGTTGTLINLLVGFFVGLSSGASVIISQFFGARRPDDVSRAVHTTMALALASGAALTVLALRSRAPGLRRSLWVLLAAAVVFLVFYGLAQQTPSVPMSTVQQATHYVRGRVIEVTDNAWQGQQDYEDIPVGKQTVRVELRSGKYRGQVYELPNQLSYLYGTILKAGDAVTIAVTEEDGEISSMTLQDYDRTVPLALVVLAFLVVTVLVGRRVGAKSLLGLGLTVVCIFSILIPLLLGGWPTLPTILGMCAYVTVVEFVILGGVNRKTLCAILGTISGVAFAALFGELACALLRVNGYKMYSAEPTIEALLQIKQGQDPMHSLQLGDLLVGGIVIAALGAVNDVAMSISSAMNELVAVNPALTRRQLLRSGMNIGRDMVGTMTNTLILALVGSSLVLMIYLSSLEPSFSQLMSGTFFSVEMVQAIASSVGVILAVPLSALIGAFLFAKHKK